MDVEANVEAVCSGLYISPITIAIEIILMVMMMMVMMMMVMMMIGMIMMGLFVVEGGC